MSLDGDKDGEGLVTSFFPQYPQYIFYRGDDGGINNLTSNLQPSD